MLKPALKNLYLKLGFSHYTVKEANALYATSAVSDLALSLLGIFVPIYIYELSLKGPGLHTDEIINGFSWVVLFYALISASTLVVILLFVRTIFNKLHLKTSLFIGIVLRALSLLFLVLAEKSVWFLVPAAIAWGTRIPFYWIPYHIFFVRRADDGDHKYGKEMSRRSFFSGIATALTPLLGGLIITNLGFEVLFFISIAVLLSATLPTVLFVKEQHHKKHSFPQVIRTFINKRHLNTTLALSGRVTSAVIFEIFWGIFLFFALGNFVEIGFLTTFSSILATVLLLVVGTLIDAKDKKPLHAVSVGINSLLHAVRPFLLNPWTFYINGILDKLNSTVYATSFVAATYEKAVNEDTSDFMVYREIILHGARLLVLSLVAVVMLLTGSWKWVFFVGAVGSGLTFLINY